MKNLAETCGGDCSSCGKAETCTDGRKREYEQRKIVEKQKTLLKARMGQIKHKIAVVSGKGGVGKSTVTANLAVALAKHGYKVGVLDADIYGPCIPKMLGMRGERLNVGPPGAFPAAGPLGIRVVSIDFLLSEDDTPVIWRGPLVTGAIRQFLSEFVWGQLDFLLIDLPPGTGDAPLSVMQLIPEMDGAIIVTIPSEISQIVVKKAITFSRQLGIPVIGIVENMSGFVCPKCGFKVEVFGSGGGLAVAEELSVPFLGSIPLDPAVCDSSDWGVSFAMKDPDSAAAKAFASIVSKIEEFVGAKGAEVTPSEGLKQRIAMEDEPDVPRNSEKTVKP
ncbi:MAG: Mrp/NBP35 family ATP-binding protein [Candidatus Brockarchaeota archaeon]|nr:Mrp/NBP35 family ATP-binding protein [Candidatus Brockarchaeota archaeon]